MTDRITHEDVEARVANVNRRIASTGRRVVAERRNGYIGLDEYAVQGGTTELACQRTITVGTKREVAEYLHAMMVGIDLSRS